MNDHRSAAYYGALESRLRGLDGLVEDVAKDLLGWYREYIDVGEYGLAVEVVAERLTPDMPVQTLRPLAAGLLAEATTMSLPENVVASLRQLADSAT